MVLVVDDDEDVRECLRDVLVDSGYTVVTAANGREALGILLDKKRPCLILLDLVMPVMDGWQFLRAVAAESELADLSIVIESAHAGSHPPTGHRLLNKPIDIDVLLTTVEQHCGSPN